MSVITQHPDPEKLCCDSMRAALEMPDETVEDPFESPECLIAYHEGLNQFGLIIHDGGRDVVIIRHCPWCAHPLTGV